MAARCVTQVSLRWIGCCTSEDVNLVTGAAMPCLCFGSGVVPHYPVRGDALLRPTARNVLWRCADPPLAPQQEVQYTEGSGSHPHLGAGLLRAGARPLRQLVHVCVRAICRHVVILLVSDCMHQRKRSASLCRFRALFGAILPALPHGSREYSTLAEKGFSGSEGGRRTGGAVVVGGALRALVVQQPVHVDGGWEADLVAEHHPTASEQHKIFKRSILRSVFSKPVAVQSSCLAHKLT